MLELDSRMPCGAKKMYDIPVAFVKLESPHPPFAPFIHIAPRHELKHAGYYAWRVQGTHDWLLKHTIAGHGRFTYEGGEIITKAGDAVLLKPGTRHDYGTADPTALSHPPRQELSHPPRQELSHPPRQEFSHPPRQELSHPPTWEVIWAHFRPRTEWLEWLNWHEVASGAMHLHISDPIDRKRIEKQLFDMNRLARSDSPRREAFAMNALEKAFLLYDKHNPNFGIKHTDPRVLAVLEYLQQHLTKKFHSAHCVAISGLSQSRLYHLFGQQVGQSPQEHLELLRIEKAKHLLEQTRSTIQDIALALGFTDPLYFSRRFKHRTGFSPREYRESMSNREQW